MVVVTYPVVGKPDPRPRMQSLYRSVPTEVLDKPNRPQIPDPFFSRIPSMPHSLTMRKILFDLHGRFSTLARRCRDSIQVFVRVWQTCGPAAPRSHIPHASPSVRVCLYWDLFDPALACIHNPTSFPRWHPGYSGVLRVRWGWRVPLVGIQPNGLPCQPSKRQVMFVDIPCLFTIPSFQLSAQILLTWVSTIGRL